MDTITLAQVLPLLATIAAWLRDNWATVGTVALVTLPSLAMAVRAHQWGRVLSLAGELALAAADLADLDQPARRAWVAARINEALPPWARPLFSAASIEAAIEYGWHTYAKPRVAAKQPIQTE